MYAAFKTLVAPRPLTALFKFNAAVHVGGTVIPTVAAAIMATGLMLTTTAAAEEQKPTTRAAAEPSFSCLVAKSPTERRICSDASLSQRDAVMKRLFNALKKDGKGKRVRRQQLAWLKARNRCRDDAACLERQYDARLQRLARAGGDKERLSGTYKLKTKDEDSEGTIWIVRETDGTLAGHITTIIGPTAHSCTVGFRGAEPIGKRWIWTAPAEDFPDTKTCKILIEPHKGSKKKKASLKLSRTEGCNVYCGARADFAGEYVK